MVVIYKILLLGVIATVDGNVNFKYAVNKLVFYRIFINYVICIQQKLLKKDQQK